MGYSIVTINFFFQHNCDINATDKDSWTALWHAYGNSDEEIMKLLLKSGADKNMRNADGATIMEDAREADDDSMMELLEKFTQSWT